MDNLVLMQNDLSDRKYRHGAYEAFKVNDPKPRDIHKASVRDRLLHHAIYRVLYPLFDKTWISDSYSCRKQKGTHKAVDTFRRYAYKVGKNNTRTCWVLQCDLKKFFASIDHLTLMQIFIIKIADKDVQALITEVVSSFYSTEPGKGLPLGNLTSQLLVNVYMNEFDQHVKHVLKARYYVRYADDFAILSHDKDHLKNLLTPIAAFLTEKLLLSLHPRKVKIRTLASGIDFLGWIQFPDHRTVRPSSRRRMFKNLSVTRKPETRTSYLGMLQHGNTHRLHERVIHNTETNLKIASIFS